MKIQELFEQQSKGTYAAVKFDQPTKDAIAKYIKDNDIPNGTNPNKLHCTVLYSRKYCPEYQPLGTIDPPWKGTPTSLEVWESKGKLRDEEPSRCLVMKFDCEQLVNRHNLLMKEHKATYDFPEYKTHITLSYDIGDMDETMLPDIKQAIKTIAITEEYGEDLDLSWADTATKED